MTNPTAQNNNITSIIKPLPVGATQGCIWTKPQDVDAKVAEIYNRHNCKGEILILEDKRDFDTQRGWFIYAMLYRLYVSKGSVKYVVQVGDKVTEEKDPAFKQIICKHDFACAGWVIEDIENPE